MGLDRQTARQNLHSSQGLSLIEILVALSIGSLLVYVSLTNPGKSEESELERAMDLIEKLTNFSINESILRNRVTRVHFDLTDEKAKIKVEYSKENQFTLPDIAKHDGKDLSTKERESKKKLENKLNSGFSEIDEFESEQLDLPDGVRILGIATSLRPIMIIDGKISIYTYPSGERDRALMIFSIFEHIATLTIEPYTGEFKRDYIEVSAKDDLEKEYEDALEKLLTEWLNV